MEATTVDARHKTAALGALAGSTDAEEIWASVGAARIALEFRDTDAMIGLEPVDPAVLRDLRDAVDRAVDRAAALGHPPALVDRAEAVYFGGDGDRAAEAFAHATAAVDLPRARYLLGLFHYTGFGCERDVPASRAHHEAAAAAGDADAMFELYVYDLTGVDGPVDDAAALDWCRRAAEAGSARAMANLGGFHATGAGVPVDLAASHRWYERAAEAGSGRAAAVLGVMTALGQGVAADDEAAERWFDRADDLGFDWRPMAAASGLIDDEDDVPW